MPDEHASLTRQSAQQLKAELLSAIATAQTATFEKTQEFVRDAQPEILSGFHAFATSKEARLTKLQGDLKNVDAATDTGIRAVEQRLSQIEEKLILNPPRPQ